MWYAAASANTAAGSRAAQDFASLAVRKEPSSSSLLQIEALPGMQLDPDGPRTQVRHLLGHLCCARDVSGLFRSREEGSLRAFDGLTKRKLCIIFSLVSATVVLLYWPTAINEELGEQVIVRGPEAIETEAEEAAKQHISTFSQIVWGCFLLAVSSARWCAPGAARRAAHMEPNARPSSPCPP